MLEIPTGPPVRGRQLWRRTGNFLLIFLWFYVYDLRFKTWGPTTFLTEFPTLNIYLFYTHYKVIAFLPEGWQHELYNALPDHYSDVIISMMTSWITSLTIVYSTIYSSPNQRKHQSSASVAFVREIHWWPVNSPHKGPVMWKMFPFDYVIMFRDIHFYSYPTGASLTSRLAKK